MTVGSRYSRVAGSLARFSCCMYVCGRKGLAYIELSGIPDA